ncbi:hypothetical protein ACFYNV_28905 [Streptomyces albidoflavus]
MADLTTMLADFLADFRRQIYADAARALEDAPPGQEAGVIITPVLLFEDHRVELEPMTFHRPGEASRG